MVHKIINNRFRIFIESFLLALVIFLIGFSIGFYTEAFRLSNIIQDYKENEIVSLDLRLQNYYYQILEEENCDFAIEQNFIFADKLYNDGLELARLEEANQISNEIKVEKKRYVLLKTELWLNTILLKERCNADFDILVYLYSEDPSNTFKVSQQKMISNVLKDLKEEYGNNLILLPISGDLDLDIVTLKMKEKNISFLPSLIINEKDVLEGFHTVEEIKEYLNNKLSNNKSLN